MAEETRKVIARLTELALLDVNAVYAYEQAIEKIEERNIRHPLEQFQDEHERHLEDLQTMIRRLGGEPPDRKPDLKGYLMETFTSLRSSAGTIGALKALRAVERFTNRTYAQSMDFMWPDEVAELIQNHCEEEGEHMRFLLEAIQASEEDRIANFQFHRGAIHRSSEQTTGHSSHHSSI